MGFISKFCCPDMARDWDRRFSLGSAASAPQPVRRKRFRLKLFSGRTLRGGQLVQLGGRHRLGALGQLQDLDHDAL